MVSNSSSDDTAVGEKPPQEPVPASTTLHPDMAEKEMNRGQPESRDYFSAMDAPTPGHEEAANALDRASQDSQVPSLHPPRPVLRLVTTRGYSTASVLAHEPPEETKKFDSDLPPLKRPYTKLANKQSHPMEHLGITLGLPAILLFDIVVPCIIYYTWFDIHRGQWKKDCAPYHNRGEVCPIPEREFDKDILGYSIISFGFGELWILLARVWRLLYRTEECAPLLSRSRWELDATCWVYGTAMIVALIPFVVGSSLVIPKLYLYGPSCLMAFLGILMAITTLHPFKIPIGINSHPRGTALRPFIYYAAEDFVAVDGLQDREFRIRYNERYQNSKAFRRMFVHLTLWWELGVCVYIGCVSAEIWTLEFHYAFGLSLGTLFLYIGIWAGTSYAYITWEMNRQKKAYEDGTMEV